jgi:hypothetical protein
LAHFNGTEQLMKTNQGAMSIEGIPTSGSEGPVFEDDDSIWSDMPGDEDTVPTYLKHVIKRTVEAPAEEDDETYSSSIWNNISAPIAETRLDSSLLNEEEEKMDEEELSVLFEDELRASARRTKITVIEEAAIDEPWRSPSLDFFHNEMVGLDPRLREATKQERNYRLKLPPEKRMQRPREIQKDDSLLDYVITLDNENKQIAEEEDSIFDGVSLMTKDHAFEKRDPFESMIKNLIDSSKKALDSALDNIMGNTDFTEEDPIDDSQCAFLAPLGSIEDCGVFAHGMCNANDESIEETHGCQENTYIDFGALPASGGGYATESNSEDPTTAKARTARSILADINEERQPLESDGIVNLGAFTNGCVEGPSESVTYRISKERKESVGLSLVESRTGTDILISNIDSRCKLASTDLKSGMTILSINKHPCPHTVAETFALIKGTSGDLEIRAVNNDAKPADVSEQQDESPVVDGGDKTGLVEDESEKKDKESTETESPNGIGEYLRGLWSDLTSILKVNDEGEKEETSPDAVEVTETESTDSSSVDSYAEKRRRAQIFRVQRLSWEEAIGLVLSAGKGGMVVAEIKENSPFRFTGLNPGMRILEINGVLCPGSLVVADNLLRGSEGDIELVVTNEEKGASVTPVLFYSDY